MFANLFRPKWRHSSPQIRARAVAKLRTDLPAHSSILRELALEDSNADVRRAALARVTDPELLLQVLAQDRDSSLRHSACEALGRCLGHQNSSAQWRDWLSRLPDDQSRAALVLGDSPSELKPVALDLITSPEVLLQLAIEAPTAALRRHCAERIETPDQLEILARESRSHDKAVHRLARERLNALREAEQEQARLEQARNQLLEHLQQLINSDDRQHFQVRFDLLQRDWQQLAPTSTAQQQRFAALCAEAHSISQALAEAQALELARVEAERAHQHACEALIAAFTEQQADIDNADAAQLEQLLAQADTLAQQGTLPPALHKLQQAAHLRQDAWRRLTAQQSELDALLAAPANSRTLRNLRALLEQINWPNALPAPSPIQQARQELKQLASAEQARKAAAAQHNEQLEAELQALEQAIEQGEIRLAQQTYEQAQEQLQQLNGHAATTLEQRFKGLSARLNEIRDWQGFVVNGKKEELCSKMEALIDSPLEPRLLADQVRALQQEWKQLDASSTVHSQRLWQRFRSAGEAAYAPCEQFFASQRELRQHNLRQREEICDQLEQFLAAVDWDNADWPAVERISHTAKREWKQFSPVDRAPGKTVQQRFNHTVRTLDHKLRDWHQQCEQTKRELIAQAAVLADSDDLHAAAEGAKALQRHWKQTGPAFRTQERQLWQSFRTHCDQIFERLKQAEAVKARTAPAPAAAEPLLSTPQQRAFDTCIEQLNQAEHALLDTDAELPLLQLDEALRKLPAPWHESLQQRLAQVQLLQEQPEQLDALLAQSEHRLRELCIRLEILLNRPSPEEDQAQRMEYQMLRLQQALAEHNRAATQADVQALELEWQTVAWHGVYPHLQLRFDTLLDQTRA